MSVRIEWVDLDHPFFGLDVVPAGESVIEDDDGEGVVPAGHLALVVSYDEVVVLAGRPEVVKQRLLQALALVEAAEEGL